MTKLILTLGAMTALSAAVLAQEPAAVSVGTVGSQARAAAVRSPEVLADSRITFRLLAPKATEVLVQGNWQGGRDLAMTKDASGLWTVTTAALQPELWAYTFSVNGVRTLDPRNYNVVRDGIGFMNVGLKRLDVFASVGIMSSGTFGRAVNGVVPGANLFEQIAPGFFADPAATNKQLRMLFLSCGTEDNRIEALTKVEADLRTRKISFTFKRYPGEHEWRVWRHSLADLAPLLFR